MIRDRSPLNLLLLLCCGVLILTILRPVQELAPVVAWHGSTMGTTYEVKLAGVTVNDADLDRLTREVDRELVAVNAAMSTYIADSEISLFNRMTSVEEVQDISYRFAEVMLRSIQVYEETGGAFNPALGPLIDLWGFGAGSTDVGAPAEEEVRERLEVISFDHVVLEEGGLRKRDPRVEINLSAVAKGYAVDRIHLLLQEEGFDHIYVEIGGEVVCSGLNPAGEAWQIGIQMPERDASASFLRVVRLENRALATSGDYRNFMGDAEEHRHHILDPRTGWPAGHSLASVSVLAEDCMTADAVATALYVMGTEEGMEWLSSRPELEALFIDRHEGGFSFTATPGFDEALVALP